jgi:polysaccharide biosynthesis protein VpsQ
MLRRTSGSVDRTVAMKWLTAAFAALLIAMVILADRGQLPQILIRIRDFPGGDKVGHFILIGTLSCLLNVSLRCARWRIGPLSILKGSNVVAVLATIEEFSQLAFASRSFSLSDLAANYAGIVVFGWIATMVMSLIPYVDAPPLQHED